MPEGLTLNGLSLNNGTTHILTELQLPIPAKKPEWVEGADANGAVLMRDPLGGERHVGLRSSTCTPRTRTRRTLRSARSSTSSRKPTATPPASRSSGPPSNGTKIAHVLRAVR